MTIDLIGEPAAPPHRPARSAPQPGRSIRSRWHPCGAVLGSETQHVSCRACPVGTLVGEKHWISITSKDNFAPAATSQEHALLPFEGQTARCAQRWSTERSSPTEYHPPGGVIATEQKPGAFLRFYFFAFFVFCAFEKHSRLRATRDGIESQVPNGLGEERLLISLKPGASCRCHSRL